MNGALLVTRCVQATCLSPIPWLEIRTEPVSAGKFHRPPINASIYIALHHHVFVCGAEILKASEPRADRNIGRYDVSY